MKVGQLIEELKKYPVHIPIVLQHCKYSKDEVSNKTYKEYRLVDCFDSPCLYDLKYCAKVILQSEEEMESNE